MKTITAILQPDPDGTLHVPVPAEMLEHRIKIVASLEPAPDALASKDARMAIISASLEKLRNTFDKIDDPVEWQRNAREDRGADTGN